MRKPKCGPVEFGDQEWSQFDFSRWHLDDLQLDESATALTNLAQQLFTSPEWQQQVKVQLPALKTTALRQFQQQVQSLETRAADLKKNLEVRTTATRQQVSALQEQMRIAAAPPRLKADPDTYQLGVKVVMEKRQLGLPTVRVRLMDSRQNPLTEGVTDLDGNVILYLNRRQAEFLAKNRTEVTLEVLTVAGQSLQRADNAICPRPNHTETYVARLVASTLVEPLVTQAEQHKAEQEARITTLNHKLSRLRTDYERQQQEIRCQVDDLTAVIRELERTDDRSSSEEG